MPPWDFQGYITVISLERTIITSKEHKHKNILAMKNRGPAGLINCIFFLILLLGSRATSENIFNRPRVAGAVL